MPHRNDEQEWNRRRDAGWRGPEPADFDLPPRRRR